MIMDRQEEIRSSYKIVVTSGPTREFIDSIRFLSNPSTGRMGYYVARAGVNTGYKVTYIHGPVPVKYSEVPGAENISVISTDDMLQSVLEKVTDNTVLIMAAAPADYKPEKKFENKLKKTENPDIRLIHNPDILLSVQQHIKDKKLQNVVLIGFAAELQNPYEYALSKLERKNLDMILLNDLGKPECGFGTETNELTVIRKNKTHTKWSMDSKERLGYKIIQEVEEWLA